MQRHPTAVLCHVESTWRAGHQLTRTWWPVRAISCPATARNQFSETIKALVFFLKIEISPVFRSYFCWKSARVSPLFLQSWVRMKNSLHCKGLGPKLWSILQNWPCSYVKLFCTGSDQLKLKLSFNIYKIIWCWLL